MLPFTHFVSLEDLDSHNPHNFDFKWLSYVLLNIEIVLHFFPSPVKHTWTQYFWRLHVSNKEVDIFSLKQSDEGINM